MKIAKKIILVSLLIGFVINVLAYTLTLQNANTCCEVHFRSRIERPFYIKEQAGTNIYTAGSPFQSTLTFHNTYDGCPCSGYSKLLIILAMFPTWQFIANLAIWSSFPAFFIIMSKKHAHTRH